MTPEERITKLEERIADLEARLAKSEAHQIIYINNPPSPAPIWYRPYSPYPYPQNLV